MRTSYDALWIRTLTKSELHFLIADVRAGDEDATTRAVAFMCAESFGIWHNRARAKLCRYFKNHPPSADKCTQMVDAVIRRLIAGCFFEQFRDQLSMAVRFAPERMLDAATIASCSDKKYIQRYADRVRHMVDSAVPPNDS